MPYLQIQTNVPACKVPDNFLKETSIEVAELLGKPESYVCVCIEPGLSMSFGGTNDPAAIVQLTNLGKHDPETTLHTTEKLTDHLHKHLGITSTRMYILFHDKQRFEVGYGRHTFHRPETK